VLFALIRCDALVAVAFVFGSMCEMSVLEFENMAILSFTLFSDFSSLLRQLSGRWRPSVADLNGGLLSTKFVISSK
jgi:hypothetical protein